MMDYALNKIMHAFDGKNKSIQYKIATDINSMQVNDDTNIYDMIQGYCADIAAVGDDRHQKINAVDSQEGGGYCGIRGHKEREYRRKKADEWSGNSTGSAGRFQGNCHYCDKLGHREADCRFKKKEQGTAASATPSSPVVPAAAAEIPKSNKVTQINPSSIQALIDHLQQSGQAKVNTIRTGSHPAESERADCNPFSVLATGDSPIERILLSLCDGAGCAGLAARNCGMTVDRFLAVERDDIATVICENVNAGRDDFPEPDHYWHSQVLLIQEKDIADLGRNRIALLAWGAPCEHLLLLRLLRKVLDGEDHDPRPGLAGEKGKVLLKCIEITGWVMRYNPDCEYFIENVDFRNLKDDWDQVCQALGPPNVLSSALVSVTKRNRAY